MFILGEAFYKNFKVIQTVLDSYINNSKDTDDYELYDPRVHSLRRNVETSSKHQSASTRGPILMNRPPKNTKPKQEVGNERHMF